MDFLFYFIVLCVADYLYFKIKFTKPDGPPVWYLFPFLGIAPFYWLPESLFLRYIDWYFKTAPDVIITRFLLNPFILVKNSAVEDAQNKEEILSRPEFGYFSSTVGYVQGSRSWYATDGGCKGVPWQSIRKTNIMALNILPKQQKFERTSEAVDLFLKTIEEQSGRVYDYGGDLSFSKLQEACNVNLGRIFEHNNLQTLIKGMQECRNKLPILLLLCRSVPLWVTRKFEWLLPKSFQPSHIRRTYGRIIDRFVVDSLQGAHDEPKDFFEAVLRLRKKDEAIDFVRNALLLNVFALVHTTMHTTIAALSYVALDKRVQAKVHQELDQVVGSAPLSYEHLNQLHYLKAVLHEANRLSPPVPKMFRRTTDRVRVGGYMLPKDMILVLYIVSESVDAKNFPKPYSFIPERFITANGEFVSSKKFNIFSRGKRRCSGIETAGLSQQVHLAKILQHFAVIPEDPNAEVPKYVGGLILTEAPMIPIRFVRREGAPVINPPDLDSGLSAVVQEIIEEESK